MLGERGAPFVFRIFGAKVLRSGALALLAVMLVMAPRVLAQSVSPQGNVAHDATRLSPLEYAGSAIPPPVHVPMPFGAPSPFGAPQMSEPALPLPPISQPSGGVISGSLASA